MKKILLTFGALSLLCFSGGAQAVKQYNVPRDTSFTVWQTFLKESKARPYIKPVWPSLPAGVRAEEGIVYSTLDYPEGRRDLHVNIYRPDNSEVLPALIMVHGGGWNSGDLTLQIPMAQQIAARGYVTVPVEYRLIPEALFPAGLFDLKEAVRWLRANASKYGVDPERIAISGCSAGGQLANLVGMTNSRPEAENVRANAGVSSDVQAVIDVDGISTFVASATLDRAAAARRDGTQQPVDMIWLGGTYTEKRDNWEAASPIYHISPASPPVCFINSSIERFHQGRDAQIAIFDLMGIYSEVHTIDDTPHPFWLLQPWFGQTVDLMSGFLDKTFKEKDSGRVHP